MQAPLNFLMRIFSFSIPRAVFQHQSRGGLAPVLEDNVGTGKHSTFCLCRMDDGKMMRGGQWWESARFRWKNQRVGRISALAVRLTLRSSDENLCADLNVVCFSVSGQIHSIDACQMMVSAMEFNPTKPFGFSKKPPDFTGPKV
ncbi:hypothetical protein HELRODRAFT_167708 [Helobdella robusta]|uniref:Uncharacterized protein n=1 Tax=Helobdella robusta TaxID=6412 RepID=T1EZP8_HELRO|nr:hypothetical protein HELRODRAFT_167708 [Helobdella robusta]ESO09890.1 hypothetical protein HELRODRAFT_167708 [Helobdella robusta]